MDAMAAFQQKQVTARSASKRGKAASGKLFKFCCSFKHVKTRLVYSRHFRNVMIKRRSRTCGGWREVADNTSLSLLPKQEVLVPCIPGEFP